MTTTVLSPLWVCTKRSHGHLVTWSHGHMDTWLHGHLVTWSHGHAAAVETIQCINSGHYHLSSYQLSCYTLTYHYHPTLIYHYHYYYYPITYRHIHTYHHHYRHLREYQIGTEYMNMKDLNCNQSNHRITVCLRKRPLNKKGFAAHQ